MSLHHNLTDVCLGLCLHAVEELKIAKNIFNELASISRSDQTLLLLIVMGRSEYFMLSHNCSGGYNKIGQHY